MKSKDSLSEKDVLDKDGNTYRFKCLNSKVFAYIFNKNEFIKVGSYVKGTTMKSKYDVTIDQPLCIDCGKPIEQLGTASHQYIFFAICKLIYNGMLCDSCK